MTPKEFAKACRATLELHEASWNDNGRISGYAKTWRECAEAVNKEWATILACLMTQGYADVWEWCDEVEAEPTLTDRIDLVRAEILDEG